MNENPARDMPRYQLPEVAAYVRMSQNTLGTWVRGRDQQPPIIHRPVSGDSRLSYNNLIEIYVIHALRQELKVPLQTIRRGIEHVRKKYGLERPLLSDQLRAREGELIFKILGEYENVGRGGQLEIPEAVEQYLSRIDHENGLPVRLYPVTRTNDPAGPRRIVILPDVGFGRPVTREHLISSAVIYDRFSAGESIEDLADDYDLTKEDVEEAIRQQGFPHAA
ncbi:MAG: DUF433 domain-containing protein [Acidobacteriota bacterium]|nr:DUF433 domain-containing protein [Acidobacteriota bacterium]